MPAIKDVMTKSSSDMPWFNFNENIGKYFTMDDIQTIIIPCVNFVQNLPGFQGRNNIFIGDNIVEVWFYFDTVANAEYAYSRLFGDNIAIEVANRYALIQSKLNAYPGITVTHNTSIIEDAYQT